MYYTYDVHIICKWYKCIKRSPCVCVFNWLHKQTQALTFRSSATRRAHLKSLCWEKEKDWEAARWTLRHSCRTICTREDDDDDADYERRDETWACELYQFEGYSCTRFILPFISISTQTHREQRHSVDAEVRWLYSKMRKCSYYTYNIEDIVPLSSSRVSSCCILLTRAHFAILCVCVSFSILLTSSKTISLNCFFILRRFVTTCDLSERNFELSSSLWSPRKW